jgi:hypothetical protein
MPAKRRQEPCAVLHDLVGDLRVPRLVRLPERIAAEAEEQRRGADHGDGEGRRDHAMARGDDGRGHARESGRTASSTTGPRPTPATLTDAPDGLRVVPEKPCGQLRMARRSEP